MSETYSIACVDCEKALWIAQSPNSDKYRGYIYWGKEHRDAHIKFLMDHMGHQLLFGPSCDDPILEYEEVHVEGDDR